jgi:hypothetical protein
MGVRAGEGSEWIVVRAPHVVIISRSSSTCPPLEVATNVYKRLALSPVHLVTARSPLRKHGGDGI